MNDPSPVLSIPAARATPAAARPPFFSVTITAYNRRTYLARAIDSVLRQTIDRSEYEIIVVKNFEDPEADRRIREHGLVGIRRDEQPLGIHLKAALDVARGEVMAFLNDDDLWVPSKLAEARARFTQRPRLGLYATSYVTIDENDRPRPIARDRFSGYDRFARNPGARFEAGPSISAAQLAAFLRANPGSDSTVAIRTSILHRFSRELETLPSSVDTFLLTCGLLSGLDLLIEYVPSTLLRVHPENMSRATDESMESYLAKYARSMGGFASAHAHMMAMANANDHPALYAWLYGRHRSLDHFASMARGELTRGRAFRALAEDVPRVGTRAPGLLASEALTVLSPSLSRTVNFLVGRRIAGA